ncbi:MAG TPA: inosine/xanthosine triphosphatase [Candidatus Paceibacterota bacterium]|nr:inosine/xanthosine triphosphatase [Candidatus Paceibacterota bacterium]
MKIIIGSESKRKIEVAERTLRQFFKDELEVLGYKALSGVPETPYDKETFDGARNRALDAKVHAPDAELYVGMESGLIERYGHIFEEAWSVILAGGKEYFGYSSGLKVPDFILAKMNALKMPHSEVMGMLEKEYDLPPSDTWKTYSGGTILREISLEESLRNALIQVTAPEKSFYRK